MKKGEIIQNAFCEPAKAKEPTGDMPISISETVDFLNKKVKRILEPRIKSRFLGTLKTHFTANLLLLSFNTIYFF